MYYTIFAKREENFLAKIDVAPLAGARIEINLKIVDYQLFLSLPSRERGLKLLNDGAHVATNLVAPLAGARIEITREMIATSAKTVAPLAGARIEIRHY